VSKKSASRQHKAHTHQKTERRLPTVALCVIAKNEEEFIGQCLDSAREFVDEIVVVDTGSTDATREIAREHGARVEEFAWCDDFAAARNAALDAATADWILMLDADEELDPESGPHLRKHATHLPDGMIGYAVMIENRRRNGTNEDWVRHSMSRMFPRRPELRFVGAIHEDLINLPDPTHSTCLLLPAVRIFHYGYDPEVYAARAKDVRNMRLLEVELARNPENARALYYLGQQHFVGGRHEVGIEYFERFAELADRVAPYFLVDAYRMWLEALIAVGDEAALEQVTRAAEEGNALSALSREVLARYEMESGRMGAALRHLLAGLNPEAPAGVTTPPGVGSWHTRILLAQTYERLGEPVAALAQMDSAFMELPFGRRYEIARQSAQVAFLTGNYGEANRWLMRAVRAAPDELDAHQDLLRVALDVVRRSPEFGSPLEQALAAEDWQSAYDAGMQLPLGTSAALARIIFLATRLREEGAPDAALDLLERAVEAYTPSRPLYMLLMQTLKDLDRFDDALAAIEVMQQLPDAEKSLGVAA
jgi:tetratricopeptide (TPR) repeat protein